MGRNNLFGLGGAIYIYYKQIGSSKWFYFIILTATYFTAKSLHFKCVGLSPYGKSLVPVNDLNYFGY